MRNKLGVHLTFTSIIVLFGCDRLIDESGHFAIEPHGGADGEAQELSHPYLSCVTPEEWPEESSEWPPIDPACYGGCGGFQENDETPYAMCLVHCEDSSDCMAWEPGGSVVSCAGSHCIWECDEDHPCPSGLECVSRGDPLPGDGQYWGECYAPDVFAPQ